MVLTKNCKDMKIGSRVNFFVDKLKERGVITDIIELGYEGNEKNIYEVTTDLGVFNLNAAGEIV